ncbi:hypothetical protein FNB79_11365 [Formosa sediminum]|uniref:Aspartate racemase n=1 Tax=Formosa sediminum TaxID=2594004 RepID=A0A516GSQ6_9FLAO|nr:aspartate/glutamate racemase family protein [Formosa sediminum]QDO94538.1 hypothetical protein FNB79_11365 [Formosa sediminum]
MTHIKLAVLGLGSRTTAYYLSTLNLLYNNKFGAYGTCPLFLLNVDFNTINPLLPNTSKALSAIVGGYLNSLDAFGAQHIIIPNITLHETVDQLNVNTTVLHPIHLTISKIKAQHCSTIVLFASMYSMQSDYIRSHFRAHGIDVLLPSKTNMEFIDKVRTTVYNGTETPNLIAAFHTLLDDYSRTYPVVLGCTELSVLNLKTNPNLIDMAQLQMETAVNHMP